MKNRQLDLLIYLLTHKKSTQGQLAEIFEVSKKTIERDIDRMSLIGVPVYCQQGGGGGVYIDERYKFDASFFSPEDIAHLVVALHITKSFTANLHGEEILKKITLAEPDLTNMFKRDVSEYFSVDIYDEPIDFESGIFEQINRCLDLKVFAQINGVETACLGYVCKADGVYLFCDQGGYTLVKVDDIKEFVQSDEHFEDGHLTYEQYKNAIK